MISTKSIFAVIIILLQFVPKGTATNTFGAHQNVEGVGVDDGQPNVIMQSVVLGKKVKKPFQDGLNNDEDESESEQEKALMKLLKLICPCKYKNSYECEEEYDDTESPVDLKLERYLKILNNKKKRKLRKYNEKVSEISEENLDRNTQLGKGATENPIRRWRNKNIIRLVPGETRKFRLRNKRFQNLKYLDDFEESNEYKENLDTKPELTRKRYEKFNERWDDEEENKDMQPDGGNGLHWNYPRNHYRFRRRRKYTQVPGKPRASGLWKQERHRDWPPDCKCTNVPMHQDILYLPHFDRPFRSRNRQSSLQGPECSAEY